MNLGAVDCPPTRGGVFATTELSSEESSESPGSKDSVTQSTLPLKRKAAKHSHAAYDDTQDKWMDTNPCLVLD